MKRKKQIIGIICAIIVLVIIETGCLKYMNGELKTVKSDGELLRIYNSNSLDTNEDSKFDNLVFEIITIPNKVIINGIRMIERLFYYPVDYYDTTEKSSYSDIENRTTYSTDPFDQIPVNSSSTTSNESFWDPVSKSGSSTSKDYSSTNIQVENVDEADITKTDGDYIYSISDNDVIITNVKNPDDIKIETKIGNKSDGGIPEDLILYKNELVIISSKNNNAQSKSYSSNDSNTIVKIYDITNKSTPILLKNYELYEPYYTSRCINNNLYVISCGELRKEYEEIDKSYKEDNEYQEMLLTDIKYLKEVQTKKQTLISVVDLDNAKDKIRLNSYLMDISNAYVSENNIYLFDEKYSEENIFSNIKHLFGIKGIFGFFLDEFDDDSNYIETEIYKFNILNDGSVVYNSKNKIKGRTINQYSFDEKDNHLRVAVYDENGARIVIFNEKLKKIGESRYVAKGETMYSSRFMGEKAYLVTYKVTDPLFVIDLSDETKPKILGELHIPGYSTYLHPYDENHLIGIGMQTKETFNRDRNGKVISTSSSITGMKMALFDVSDVKNPVQISQTIIGDSRTTSAILTNPKALLFSKEKQLIAIPVNNYKDNFEINSSGDAYSSMVNSYKNYNKSYISEGYLVYNLNLDEGFKLKGTVTHQNSVDSSNSISYYYSNKSRLLRGLYIEDNLYTISEDEIKVNRLDNLDLIDELRIR